MLPNTWLSRFIARLTGKCWTCGRYIEPGRRIHKPTHITGLHDLVQRFRLGDMSYAGERITRICAEISTSWILMLKILYSNSPLEFTTETTTIVTDPFPRMNYVKHIQTHLSISLCSVVQPKNRVQRNMMSERFFWGTPGIPWTII